VNNKSNDVNKHNVKILGDSHLRGSSIRIGEYFEDKFDIYGMIKPGAIAADIIAQTNTKYKNLTKNDVIVFNGGSSDVYRNFPLSFTLYMFYSLLFIMIVYVNITPIS
jgi:hypothetical protein